MESAHDDIFAITGLERLIGRQLRMAAALARVIRFAVQHAHHIIGHQRVGGFQQ